MAEERKACYKLVFDNEGTVLWAENSRGERLDGPTEVPEPFHVDKIVAVGSNPYLITLDASGVRHCWRYILGKLFCVSC